jgi:hypothetical protein
VYLLFAIKLSYDFKQGSNICNNMKITKLKCIVLSVDFARNWYHLTRRKGLGVGYGV